MTQRMAKQKLSIFPPQIILNTKTYELPPVQMNRNSYCFFVCRLKRLIREKTTGLVKRKNLIHDYTLLYYFDKN